MLAMVGDLLIEPGVYRGNEVGVIGCEEDLAAAFDVAVGNGQTIGAHHQFVQTGHVCTVDHLRIVEIALTELDSFLGQMRTNQSDLCCVAVIGDHLLEAAVLQRFKDMRGTLQVERHDLCAAFGHLLLLRRPNWLATGRRRENQHQYEHLEIDSHLPFPVKFEFVVPRRCRRAGHSQVRATPRALYHA